jgi:hypothetical protein
MTPKASWWACVMIDRWRIRYYPPHAVGEVECWTLSGVGKAGLYPVNKTANHRIW